MTIDWKQVRAQFPMLEKWTYLNTATFGPAPSCAVEALLAHLRRRDEQACFDFLDWFTDAEQVREGAARWIGAAREDIAFVPNAGTALAWLINGIDWKPEDEIVTFADEFPNNLYFPKVLERRGVRFTELTLPDGRFSVEEFLSELTARTRLVLLSTVNYSTGFRPPLQQIGAALREREILFYLDGTQSVGALCIDVGAIHVDMLAVHGYKWMLCPSGIGFVYVRPEVREWLDPAVYSWRSHKNWRDVDQLHHGLPELPAAAMKYEGGMQNFCGIFAMGAVLDLLHSLGSAEVEKRVMENAAETGRVLRSHGGKLLSDEQPYYDSPIVTAQFPGVDVSKLALDLHEQRIEVAARKGYLRVSPHFFNNEDDFERLDKGLRDLAGA